MHGHKARDNRIEPLDSVGERILKMEGLTRVHAWARDAVKLEQLKARPKVGRAQGLVSTNTDFVSNPGKLRSITPNLSIQYLFKYLCIYVSRSCMKP